MAINWVVVKDSGNGDALGAVGFIGNEIATIVAFYEDKDFNRDGRVDLGERFLLVLSQKGRALVEVAFYAQNQDNIWTRDPSIRQLAGQLTVNYAVKGATEGIYRAYFAFGISQAAGGVAAQITQSGIKGFAIKKGMEATVKRLYEASLGL